MSSGGKEPLKGNHRIRGLGDEPLEACVRKIAASGDLPAISHHIQELMAISTNEKASLSQLANVILKNVSLTAKLLRQVNTVYFNYQRTPIYSVSHAIVILGWDTIRDTAASIMLLGDFGKKSETVRDLLLLSVLTANNSMVIATRCKYPRKEEAYLCGMFSVFGELLVATYMPEEYSAILEAVTPSGGEQHSAAYEVIGFTYDQLGRAMLRNWGMPEKLGAGARRLASVSQQPQTDDQWLSLIAGFSHELTNEVFRSGPGKEHSPQLKSLLSTFGPFLSVTETNLQEVLAQSYAQTEKAFSSARVALDKTKLTDSISRATAEIVPKGQEQQVAEEPVVEGPTRINKEALRRFTVEVESVLHSGERLEVNDIVAMIMEAMFRGAGFDRVLFCLMSQSRTELLARLAVGQGAEELKQKFVFPISFLEGPVGPAIMKRKDVFVPDISASHYARSEFARIVGARSLMMVPVQVNQKAIGCLYADRVSETLVLDEEGKALLLKLRDFLCDEIASRKQ